MSVFCEAAERQTLKIINMIKSDEKSNAQSWELEIACKNKKYLDSIVSAILKYGMINFEVEMTDVHKTEPEWDARYSVLIWCSWFHKLKLISEDLAKIEEDLDGY